MYNTAKDILDLCKKNNTSISQIVIGSEIEQSNTDEETIYAKLDEILQIMEHSSSYPINNVVKPLGGLIGGEAKLMTDYLANGDTVTGEWTIKAMARAFASSEYNASMGKICAAPTAGSCGIIPAAILTIGEKYNLSRKELLDGLLTSSGIGKIISVNATVSGAEGGCQAECGSAAAMAAAAIVEMVGGSPEMAFNAAAIALKNIMGLICDPVAGLVESPCSKRNASGVINAMISADIALSGITSIVPFDEVVEAMYNVGKSMHPNFKETSKGGIAITKTGIELAKKLK